MATIDRHYFQFLLDATGGAIRELKEAEQRARARGDQIEEHRVRQIRHKLNRAMTDAEATFQA